MDHPNNFFSEKHTLYLVAPTKKHIKLRSSATLFSPNTKLTMSKKLSPSISDDEDFDQNDFADHKIKGSVVPTKTLYPNVFHGKGSFPLNLTLLLESVESMGMEHLVSWLPDGGAFVIKDPAGFLNLVLPMFFK